MTDETRPAETEAAVDDTPAAPQEDLFDVDMGDLRKRLEGQSSEDYEAPAEEPQVAEEQEDVEASPEPPTDETPVEEPATEPQSDEEPAATPEPPSEMELLQARIEQQEAKLDHWKSLAERNAGEIGHRQQRVIEEQKQEIAQLRQQLSGDQADYIQPTAPLTQERPAATVTDDVTAWAIQKALRDAGQDFLTANPSMVDLSNGGMKLKEDFSAALKEQDHMVAEMLSAPDPIRAAQMMTSHLAHASNKVMLDRKTAHLQDLERKKADQAANMRNKRRESASASAGAGSTRPEKKKLDPSKMPLDELRQRISEGRFT